MIVETDSLRAVKERTVARVVDHQQVLLTLVLFSVFQTFTCLNSKKLNYCVLGCFTVPKNSNTVVTVSLGEGLNYLDVF